MKTYILFFSDVKIILIILYTHTLYVYPDLILSIPHVEYVVIISISDLIQFVFNNKIKEAVNI